MRTFPWRSRRAGCSLHECLEQGTNQGQNSSNAVLEARRFVPYSANSCAAVKDSPRTPHLLAQYPLRNMSAKLSGSDLTARPTSFRAGRRGKPRSRQRRDSRRDPVPVTPAWP